jgi:hypothetical protein
MGATRQSTRYRRWGEFNGSDRRIARRVLPVLRRVARLARPRAELSALCRAPWSRCCARSAARVAARRRPVARHRRLRCRDAHVGRRDAQQKRAFDGRAVGRKVDVIEHNSRGDCGGEAQGPGRHSVARGLGQQDNGRWLRRDNVWSKPNSMPEGCKDRPVTYARS